MPNSWYRDKVVLVTGASSGIGRAVVEEAIAAGARVVALARSEETLKEIVQGRDQAIAVAADVRDREQVQHAIIEATNKFGRIDVAIANAGIEYLGPTAELVDAEIQAMFDTNFFGFFHLAQAVLPVMSQQEGKVKGTIVQVSSPMARFAFAWSGGYAASKAATDAFVMGLRRELTGSGIRFVTVYPGATATQVGKELPNERVPYWHHNGKKMEADECARNLLDAVATGRPVAALARQIQMLMMLQRLTPWLSERIIQKAGIAVK